jgi:SAM-dependent methyltransferase
MEERCLCERLTMEYVNCNICDVDDTEPWDTKDGMNIVRCKRCGLVYSKPRPTRDELKDYYDAVYFDTGNYTSDEQRYQMYKIEVRQMLKIIGNKGRFLDVGAAQGKFLTTLPETFDKYGVEFSESAARDGRKLYNLNIKVGELHHSGYEDKFFDVVHFRGVFEHLLNPSDELYEARRILKDNGWLIISTTPNINSPCARYYKKNFRLCIPKEHIYYFSDNTLVKILTKTGFIIKRRFYPYLNTPYENLLKDLVGFVVNRLRNELSPPFFRSVITVYAQKQDKRSRV